MDINEIIRQVTEEICSKYGAQTQTPAAGDGYTPADMAKYIDHTYLKPEASVNEIRKICDEAKKYHCASVCVNPSYIQYVAQQLISDLSAMPYYWSAENSSGEVDFVLQHSGNVIPLEVKAEENLQAKSLKYFVANNGLPFGVRTSMSDYRKQDKLINLPLYALSQLWEVCDAFN